MRYVGGYPNIAHYTSFALPFAAILTRAGGAWRASGGATAATMGTPRGRDDPLASRKDSLAIAQLKLLKLDKSKS